MAGRRPIRPYDAKRWRQRGRVVPAAPADVSSIVGVLGVLAVWGAFVALALIRARSDTRDGHRHPRERSSSELTPGELLRGEGVDQLRVAGADFRRARQRVRSPFLLPRADPSGPRSPGRLGRHPHRFGGPGRRHRDRRPSTAPAPRSTPATRSGAARVALVDHIAAIADHSAEPAAVGRSRPDPPHRAARVGPDQVRDPARRPAPRDRPAPGRRRTGSSTSCGARAATSCSPATTPRCGSARARSCRSGC